MVCYVNLVGCRTHVLRSSSRIKFIYKLVSRDSAIRSEKNVRKLLESRYLVYRDSRDNVKKLFEIVFV